MLVNHDKMQALNPPGIGAGPHNRARYHEPSYIWMPDSNHLLFDSNGQLWLFDLASRRGVQMASTHAGSGDQPNSLPTEPTFPIFGITISNTQTSKTATLPQAHGLQENLLNGEVDWVYEEELDVRSNYFWSPDSKHLAYLQTDESRCRSTRLSTGFRRMPRSMGSVTPNQAIQTPAVRVGVVSVNGGKTKWINVPFDSGNDYIPRFGWVNDTTLWIETLTRNQKKILSISRIGRTTKLKLMLTKSDDKFLDEHTTCASWLRTSCSPVGGTGIPTSTSTASTKRIPWPAKPGWSGN